MLHTLSIKEAEKRGYRPLAGPYDLGQENRLIREREHRWWANICQDLCTVDAVAVEVKGGMEVWRHESELIEIPRDNG